MINADMREYQYHVYGDANAYGQPSLSPEAQGVVKMAIYTTSQAIHESIKYNGATYIGLTNDSKVNDAYVIKYKKERLKVLYVQPHGRFMQVFMGAM